MVDLVRVAIIVPLLVWLLAVYVSESQTFYYYDLSTDGSGGGTSCSGSGSISKDGLNMEVKYDLSKAYKADGWSNSKHNRSYSFTICGILSNSTCVGDWCFEQVNVSNHNECLQGIARWEVNDNTTISYGVYFNESNNKPDKPVALHVQIANYNEKNIKCPNDESWISYNIFCDHSLNGTQFLSLYENYSNCEWNVSLKSTYGCVETNSSIVINSGGSSKNNKLSTGSVLVIIFVVILLTYLILGCAYNSFYHGRVGIDAIPNKNSWSQLWRYFKAGCETTYDILFCHQGNVDYQNL